jgi:hypothetical protein
MPVRSNTAKKTFNVDSPSFTPSFLSANDATGGKKPAAISPKAASAAPFMPKSIISRKLPLATRMGLETFSFSVTNTIAFTLVDMSTGASAATPPIRQETATPEWAVAEAQDFIPQHFEPSHSQLVCSIRTASIPPCFPSCEELEALPPGVVISGTPDRFVSRCRREETHPTTPRGRSGRRLL